MITRPLDLASKLRPEPRSMDWLFYVNAGLIVLFFSLFGSRFVLVPGIEFELQEVVGANGNAVATTDSITVINAEQILAGDGLRDTGSLGAWLKAQARLRKQQHQSPMLQVIANKGVPHSTVAEIAGLAKAAGFRIHSSAREPAPPAKPPGR